MLKIKIFISFLILIAILISIFIFYYYKNRKQDSNEEPIEIYLPLSKKIIFLDPGHGGLDPGAVYQNVKESTINLEISLTLASELEKNGAIVFLTRDEDYDLSEKGAYSRKKSDLSNRSKLINESFCNLYLSIHLNAASSSNWRGAQIFYDDINPENKKLAEKLQEVLNDELKGKREIKEIKTLYMYRNIIKPGVLVEFGFLSNPNDRYLLKKASYQKKLAEITTKALIEYFNEQEDLVG